MALTLNHVWKTYTMGQTEVHALRNVSLSVPNGEFLAIQGPSGSGKSTLMSLVGCLDMPTRGTIYLDNYNVAKLHESALAQIRGKKIGFIFQKFNLLTNLTACENVELPMMFQRMPKAMREKRAASLLQNMGLGDRTTHKPTELSGGQQQRVAIARALATDPEIILADEPTGNLDSATGKQIMRVLQSLHQEQGKTIILVTHDNALAAYAQRIIFLHDGTIATERRRKK